MSNARALVHSLYHHVQSWVSIVSSAVRSAPGWVLWVCYWKEVITLLLPRWNLRPRGRCGLMWALRKTNMKLNTYLLLGICMNLKWGFGKHTRFQNRNLPLGCRYLFSGSLVCFLFFGRLKDSGAFIAGWSWCLLPSEIANGIWNLCYGNELALILTNEGGYPAVTWCWSCDADRLGSPSWDECRVGWGVEKAKCTYSCWDVGDVGDGVRWRWGRLITPWGQQAQ